MGGDSEEETTPNLDWRLGQRIQLVVERWANSSHGE